MNSIAWYMNFFNDAYSHVCHWIDDYKDLLGGEIGKQDASVLLWASVGTISLLISGAIAFCITRKSSREKVAKTRERYLTEVFPSEWDVIKDAIENGYLDREQVERDLDQWLQNSKITGDAKKRMKELKLVELTQKDKMRMMVYT
mmetsp:Transcript_24147/g.58377  ORF Transcript_24147/g.58377 Transcript_24147/m.58377 type:complete len:145 (-) Transcript_24147:12-446(-)|eukprot:CAMPEP_0114490822 /NCGR_PEP_ID=MMETSP0109-20121206/2657_1 /TAXON_ID=29199 /ORGANISM="Chlorarachnion reptans, Strain CCCM449" /LENGTH=144 /DNA_ID=CAMNT_0001667485 /DNA_START=906 /DNA_END=1340 /DNA_ORIENTATION=-